MSDGSEQAKRAGRGGLAVLAAKVFFIATGLLQQALLPRAISLADYGALSRVLAVSNVFNNVVVSSSTQGVSRTVAAAGEHEREALRATLRIHVIIALGAAAVLAAAAPLVAFYQHAPDILAPLLVMTAVLAIYGVYAPLIGYLNGRGLFARQATLDVVAATLRTCGLLGVGYFFARHAAPLARACGTSPGLLGATIGAVFASVGVFVVALRWTGTGKTSASGRPAGVPGASAYIALVVPVMVAQLFTNGLMQADIFLLGHYVSLAAPQTGVVDPAKAANEWVAVYRACQLFAFLPYQLLFAVTQVLFPMLARAKAEDGEARVAELVRRGCRIGAIVCGMLLVVVVAMPESLVKFAYGAEVATRAVSTLRMLALGQAAFAILGLSTTVLVSLGRERDAMAVTAVALALLVAGCVVSISGKAFGEAQLLGAARGVLGSLVVALAIGAVRVRSVTGAFMPWKTAVRVGLAVALGCAAGTVTPVFSRLATPVVAAGFALAYVLVLVATGELGREDLTLVRSIAARGSKR